MEIRRRSAAFGAAASFAMGRPGRAEASEIIIGAPNALTGGYAEASQRYAQGLQTAIAKINAEGGIAALGGARLRAIVADTSWDNPAQAASVTRRMLSEDKAVALVGCNVSAMTLSAQVEAERARVPLITASYADALVQRGMTYTFKLSMQSSVIFGIALKYAIEMIAARDGTPPKRLAVYTASDAASLAVGQAAKALAIEQKIAMVAQISYASGMTDPTPMISSALQSRPDVILTSSGTDDLILLTRALRGVGLKVPIVGGGGAIATDSTGRSLGPAANGLIGVTDWNGDLPIPGVAEIVDGYHTMFPKNPFPPASEQLGTGYVAGMIIRQALEKTGSSDPQKLRDFIAGNEFAVPMPGGKVAFDAHGLTRTAVPIMVGWKDAQLRTFWPKEFQTVPPVF